MYQFAPSHNAVFAAGPRTSWKYQVGSQVNSGLALVGNKLIFDTFGDDVIALDSGTGARLWNAHLDNTLMSTPVIDRTSVFVGTGDNGSGGSDTRSFAYASGPGASQMWGRSAGDHVVALALSSGAPLWARRTFGEDMPSAVVADGVVAFSNGDFHAYGLAEKTGVPIWRTDLPGVSTMASATGVGSVAFFSYCDFEKETAGTAALDLLTGKVLWRALLGNCDSSPTYGNGRLFLSGISGNTANFGFGGRAVVAALSARTGNTAWLYRSKTSGPYTKVGSSERAITGVFDKNTYFQSLPTEDRVVAFDGESGRIRWQFRTSGPVKMSAVAARGRLYFGDTVGVLYELDEKTGRLLKTRLFDKPFSTSPPIVAGDTLYIADGSVIVALAVPL